MGAIAYPWRFQSRDGNTNVYFPTAGLEYEPGQEYRAALAAIVGANYPFDLGSRAPWPVGPGEESVRFLIVGANEYACDLEFRRIASALRRLGLGKLWIRDGNGDQWWSWAKLSGRPEKQVGFELPYIMPVVVPFFRLSDWTRSTPATGSSGTITATPTTFTIPNPGDLPTQRLTLRLRATGAAGIVNPVLTNLSNGYSWSSTRDSASANSEIKLDCERMRVLWSDDDGSTYADDWALTSLGDKQRGIMQLEPGDNALRYSSGGTPALAIEWEFEVQYEI